MRRRLTMRQRFFLKNFLINAILLLVPILLIGPYSIYQLKMESINALRKSNYNVLFQMEETMDSLLSELDNIYYYLRSNPSITTNLKAAYSESELTLNSIRNTNNLSSLLRYYINTNEYVETIYVYYYNENNRLLVPQMGMISTEGYMDTQWMDSVLQSEEDIWLETGIVTRDQHSKPIPVIYYFRKLYSTIDPSNPIGVIVMQYRADMLKKYANSLGLYENQMVAITDDNGQILFQNQEEGSSVLLDLENTSQPGEYLYYDRVTDHKKHTVSQMSSHNLKGLNYISVVPTENILESTNQFAKVFGMLVSGTILVSVLLAVLRTKQDYERLERILNLLGNPELAISEPPVKNSGFLDPYNYITYNIINLFLQQKYLKVQTSEQKYKLQAMELLALQQQINPHFLHNTLNTIYWEAISLTKGPNDCSEMLTNLASIMRYSLSNPKENVTLEEELGYLKNYIYIQNRRYNHKFRIEYDIDEKALIYPIQKIILQPIVENAINHGIKEKSGEKIIHIKIHCRPDYIYISVLDNGVGITREHLMKLWESFENTEDYNLHVGLFNSHRRLVLTYGPCAKIHIRSHVGVGTCVFFRLPMDGNAKGD